MPNTAPDIDEIESGPILVAEGAPYCKVVVDRDWIRQSHDLYGAADVFEILLEWKLGRMHADHHQALILVLLRPRAHVRKLAKPVDARVGPDVDEDDLSAKVGSGQRLRVEPCGSIREGRQLTFELSL